MTIALVGVLAGGLLAFGLDLVKTSIQESRPLPDQAPNALVSNIQMFTPDLPIPNPNDPTPPDQLARQLKDVRTQLTAPDLHLALAVKDANKLIADCQKSKSLKSLESPFMYVDVEVWMSNIERAVGTMQTSYSRIGSLEALRKVAGDKALNDGQRDEKFKQILAGNVDYQGAFHDVGVIFGRSKEDAKVVQLEAAAKRIDARVMYGAKLHWPRQGLHDGILIQFGSVNLTLLHEGAYLLAESNQKISSLIANFDPEDVASLLDVAIASLREEVETLRSFLTESQRLINASVKPRLRMETVLSNQSRSPTTVNPHGVLRVSVQGEKEFLVSVVIEDFEREKTEVKGTSDQYVTVKSGELLRVQWLGEFDKPRGEWEKLRSAFQSGVLNCALVVETVSGNVAASKQTKFGERTPWGEDKAKNLAERAPSKK